MMIRLILFLSALTELAASTPRSCSPRMCEDPEQPWGTGTYASPMYGGEGYVQSFEFGGCALAVLGLVMVNMNECYVQCFTLII